MMDPRKRTLIILGFLLLVSTFLIILGRIRAKRKRKEIAEIIKKIDTNLGAGGSFAADVIMETVKPDPEYRNAAVDVTNLMNAKGVFNDDEAAIFKILTGKTKRQLRSISDKLKASKGITLGQYLQQVFMEPTDCYPNNIATGGDCYVDYNRAMKIIESAKA